MFGVRLINDQSKISFKKSYDNLVNKKNNVFVSHVVIFDQLNREMSIQSYDGLCVYSWFRNDKFIFYKKISWISVKLL